MRVDELKIKELSLGLETKLISSQEARILRRLRKTRARARYSKYDFAVLKGLNGNTKEGRAEIGKLRRQPPVLTLQEHLEKFEDGLRNFHKDQSTWSSLRHHRVHVVRPEARASHLARGFLNGVEYALMEEKTYHKVDFDRILSIAERFSDEAPQVLKQRFSEWRDNALNHLSTQPEYALSWQTS